MIFGWWRGRAGHVDAVNMFFGARVVGWGARSIVDDTVVDFYLQRWSC